MILGNATGGRSHDHKNSAERSPQHSRKCFVRDRRRSKLTIAARCGADSRSAAGPRSWARRDPSEEFPRLRRDGPKARSQDRPDGGEGGALGRYGARVHQRGGTRCRAQGRPRSAHDAAKADRRAPRSSSAWREIAERVTSPSSGRYRKAMRTSTVSRLAKRSRILQTSKRDASTPVHCRVRAVCARRARIGR